jgi:hypothetical protein
VRRHGAALVVLVLLFGCGAGRVVRRGQVNEDALGAIRSGLPPIRELEFTAPVPALALSREEISAMVANEIDQSYAPGDVERMQRVYSRLGLLPPGSELRPALQRLYEQEGAGFYDPRTKRLVLAKTAMRAAGMKVDFLGRVFGRDFVGEFLVAHELTHALQDQHFGIPTQPEPVTDSHGDRELARRALLEGDATLAGFAYLFRGTPDAKLIATIERQLHGVPAELAKKYPDVPELVRASLAFQYDDGTTFTGRALTSGGWAAVDRAQADPPVSTEQVLHPERYFEHRDPPVDVRLGGTDRLEAAGWTRIFEDTFGELQVRVLAARALAPDEAARIAAGWGGDRLRALARGDDVVLVWMTAWDTPDDAAEFAAAMPRVNPDMRVEQRDRRALVLVGPAPDGLSARVWAETRVSGG